MATLKIRNGITITATLFGLCLTVNQLAFGQNQFQTSGEKAMRAILPSTAQCGREGGESMCELNSPSNKRHRLLISYGPDWINADQNEISKDDESTRYTRMMADIVSKSGPFSAADVMSCIKNIQIGQIAPKIAKGAYALKCVGTYQKIGERFEMVGIGLQMNLNPNAMQRF